MVALVALIFVLAVLAFQAVPFWLLLLGLVVAVFATAYREVDEGTVAVGTLFGSKQRVLFPGAQLVVPGTQLHVFSTRLEECRMAGDTSVLIYTHDQQRLTVEANVYFRVDPHAVYQLFDDVADLEHVKRVIVIPAALEAIRTVLAETPGSKLMSSERNEVGKQIRDRLVGRFHHPRAVIEDFGPGGMFEAPDEFGRAGTYGVTIEEVLLTNVVPSESMLLLARSRVETNAQAYANETLKGTLSPEVLDLRKTEALARHARMVVYGAPANAPIVVPRDEQEDQPGV